METGEWGKPVKVDVSQKRRDWMTKVLDHQVKKSALCLEGTGRVMQSFKQSVM